MGLHSRYIDLSKVFVTCILVGGFMLNSYVKDTELHPTHSLIEVDQIDDENAILTQKQQLSDYLSQLQILYELQLQIQKNGSSPTNDHLEKKDLLINVQ